MSNETMQSNENKTVKLKDNIPIILILLLSAILNIWNIWELDFANKYYAAGVYSMGQNLHAFFFNSFDSLGFITIDKPPLGFWIQVLFTKVFGFSGSVLILPQAMASVISVYLIYRIIGKRVSKSAGLIAAAVLALTPIFVAVSRNNTIDGILILLMVLAAQQTLLATEQASMKHLIFAGVFIGLGFNVKMLQAYMIVPAIYLTYLIFAKQKFFKKVLVCAVSVLVLLVVSLSWVVVVDMIPEEDRPYIGSSDSNSALDLAIGYNGINRIFRGGVVSSSDNTPPNMQGNQQMNKPPIQPNAQSPNQNNPNMQGAAFAKPNQPNNMMNNKKGGGGESGETGIVRLFNQQNAGQIAWFIFPSVFSVLGMLWLMIKGKFKSEPKNIAYLFFVLCFVPMFIYFSFASGLAHRYYFATFAPFIAALIGIGFYHLINGKKLWIPIVFVASALVQLFIHNQYSWLSILTTVCVIVFVIAAAGMIISIVLEWNKKWLIAFMCTLLILPFVWSLSSVIYNDNSQLPIAGPELIEKNDRFDNDADYSELISYLEENREGAAYLVMTESSMSFGADLILQSGEPVMTLGGFNGGDTPLTLEEFIDMVENNQVRFALVDDSIDVSNAEIYTWIRQNGTIIRPAEYGGVGRNSITLYKLN